MSLIFLLIFSYRSTGRVLPFPRLVGLHKERGIMKVKAKQEFGLIIDATIGRTRNLGEEWEVTEERAKVLLNAGLVTVVEEPEIRVAAPEEIEEIKPKKRGRPKKS